MHGYMLACGALGAACALIGSARFVAWVLDRREEASTRAIRDAVFVSQARAELAERDHSIAMLDQEWMGQGWSTDEVAQ